jgi:hypothetical protein
MAHGREMIEAGGMRDEECGHCSALKRQAIIAGQIDHLTKWGRGSFLEEIMKAGPSTEPDWLPQAVDGYLRTVDSGIASFSCPQHWKPAPDYPGDDRAWFVLVIDMEHGLVVDVLMLERLQKAERLTRFLICFPGYPIVGLSFVALILLFGEALGAIGAVPAALCALGGLVLYGRGVRWLIFWPVRRALVSGSFGLVHLPAAFAEYVQRAMQEIDARRSRGIAAGVLGGAIAGQILGVAGVRLLDKLADKAVGQAVTAMGDGRADRDRNEVVARLFEKGQRGGPG